MDIIVPFSIRKRELGGAADEAKAIFAKIKTKPDLAEAIRAKGLPPRTTLHKVYATSPNGARRLLFFCRHEVEVVTGRRGPRETSPERWVLLFYRDKNDDIGANMSAQNPAFETALNRNLALAIQDLTASTPENPKFDRY